MSYKEALRNINTFIFDVDGVLTDGSVILDPSGEMVRTMNTRDGYALQHAIKKGYNICIITERMRRRQALCVLHACSLRVHRSTATCVQPTRKLFAS